MFLIGSTAFLLANRLPLCGFATSFPGHSNTTKRIYHFHQPCLQSDKGRADYTVTSLERSQLPPKSFVTVFKMSGT